MVIVHDAELLGQTDDAAGTTRLQLVSEALEEILSRGLATGGSATDISSENLACELTVVKRTATVLVVKVVEGVQILASTRNKN